MSDIALQLGVSDSQIRKWKSTDKWDAELNGALPLSNSNVTNEKGTKKQQKKKKKESIAKEFEEVIENGDLTEKQRLFCIYYLKYLNATKAYQKAYGCQYVTARVNASRMLTNANIKNEVDRLTELTFAEEIIDMKLVAKKVLQKYIDIALSDITDYLSFGREEVPVMGPFGPLVVDGNPVTKVVNVIKLKESSEVDGTVLSEVSQGKDGVKVKLADKMRALDFLAKHTGLLSADIVEKLDIEREKLAIMKRKEEGLADHIQITFEGEDALED